MKKLPKNSGQALLIVLLIMAVALTIGLAVTSRTVTDIEISEQTEEAARAFSAAEAGIEEQLVSISEGDFESGEEFEEEGVSYIGKKSNLGEEQTGFVFPQEASRDEIKTLYLANYEIDGTLTQFYTADAIDICWGGNAAIEVSIYYQVAGVYNVARAVIDPDSARTPGADSPAGQCTELDADLTHKKTLNFNSLGLPAGRTLLFLRIRVLYESTKVGVGTPGGSGGLLPSQGVKIESTGMAGTSNRKVEVIRLHPAPPGIFDFLLYSKSNLVK